MQRALRAADVVKVNEAEAAAVGRCFDVEDPIEELVEHGVIVALTRGAQGAVLVKEDERFQASGVVATGGDTVGCGDAFTAVLTCGLLAGTPLDRLVEQACAYAGYVASQVGGMPAIPDEVALAARPG